jgi:transcriptional regulator with XRE-family HTH domain
MPPVAEERLESARLAENLRLLREARGLSQVQMARRAALPRATWTHLESGSANPTLAVLLKVAAALQVRLEELLEPAREPGRHVPAAQLPERRRGDATIRKLLPESLAGLDIERMRFPARGRLVGVPHTPGTREYLTCERGEIELAVAGVTYHLVEGDVVSFRGDQKHSYFNPADRESIAYSVIAFAPPGSG